MAGRLFPLVFLPQIEKNVNNVKPIPLPRRVAILERLLLPYRSLHC